MTQANLAPLYQRISGSVYRGAFLFLTSLLFIMVHKRKAIGPWGLRIGACALVIVDLYLFGAQFVKTHTYSSSAAKEAIVSQLNRKPDQGRVVTSSPLFLPNDGLLYEFPSLLGYDPLLLRRYVHYIQSSQNQKQDDHVVNLSGIRNPNTKLLKLLNVKQNVIGEKILEQDSNIGYLRIVKRAVVKPHEEALTFMKSDAFDPEREVCVAVAPDLNEKIGLPGIPSSLAFIVGAILGTTSAVKVQYYNKKLSMYHEVFSLDQLK